jgi:hypothetical protein
VLNEPRALVVADMLADSLKRAPHTMARHYKQIANAGLRELISSFNCQRVPAVLFDYRLQRTSTRALKARLSSPGWKPRLSFSNFPNIHLASCAAFISDMRQSAKRTMSRRAHVRRRELLRRAGSVWLAADIESKLEVDVESRAPGATV